MDSKIYKRSASPQQQSNEWCGISQLKTMAGLFKAGLSSPRVKFDFRYKSLRSKFTFILFAYNLMIGLTLKRRDKIVRENNSEQKKKKPGLKFNPG